MSSDTLALAKQFRALFDGRTDAYGLRHGEVVRAPLSIRQYAQHLGGALALGVFPLLDDGTVRFCAIDLDRPDPDTAWALAELLPETAHVERTRSGNYHVWSFFAAPIPAWVARFIMRSALEAARQENVEVFPKTDSLRPGMLGNYINLPYAASTSSRRQTMVDPLGNPIPVFEWLPMGAIRTSGKSWVLRAKALGGRKPAEREDATPFGEQETLHPCAEYIYKGAADGSRPLHEGHRSKVLFALAKQLLNWKHHPSIGWVMLRLMDVNETASRPLPEREVERIIRSVLDGRYTSTSCDDPVVRPYCRPDCPIAHG